MILYRLQRKDTGEFLCQINVCYRGQTVWNDKGTFFRTIDTMKKHLAYMIGEYVAREKDGFPRNTKYKGSLHWPWRERWDRGRFDYKEDGFKFHLAKLKHYQVIVNDVTIKGEKVIQGIDFANSIGNHVKK